MIFKGQGREDTTTLDFLTYRNASMLDILNTDFKITEAARVYRFPTPIMSHPTRSRGTI